MSWRITRTQTTFWDFESPEASLRVHFIEKFEHRFVSSEVDCIEIADDHPVLTGYRHPNVDVYFFSRPYEPEHLSHNLQHDIDAEVAPWRSATEYFNQSCSIQELLERGHGLLFSGPAPLAAKIGRTLATEGVRFKPFPGRPVIKAAKALWREEASLLPGTSAVRPNPSLKRRRATARHLAREAPVVYHALRGPGAVPLRAA